MFKSQALPSPSHIAVLIGQPGRLHHGIVEAASNALQAFNPEPSRWLAPEEACDLPLRLMLRGDDPGAGLLRSGAPITSQLRRIESALRASLGSAEIDVAIVPATNRQKQLLLADMDSTIIQQECIDEMGEVLGLKAQIAAITERAMRGELNFDSALRERLGLLKGISAHALQNVYRERITLMPGALTLVKTMRAHGAFCALVSGGFTFFTQQVADRVGFNVTHANELEFDGGALTGGVTGAILGREAKRAALTKYRSELQLPVSATLAVGDGANDLDMIKEAGLGVAYRAKPIVAAEAAAQVNVGDLTSLLYLQGYTKAEFLN